MKNLILSLGIIVSIMFGVKAQENQQKPVDNPNAPDIKFTSEIHDYGTIQKGTDGNCTFNFTNTGKEPLILADVIKTCGCTTPSWTKDPVLAGKSGKIDIHYDTMRLGQFSKQITVKSNAKSGNVVLQIKGNVIDAPAANIPDKPGNNATPVTR